ncbi:MAG: chorismate synthase, partial [Firmicutes bacterium]|nr:chorismate synthase [Bacillota bacterium]
MSSSFGKNINISIFGESHGEAIGVVVDGLPAGEVLNIEKLKAFLARRAPGKEEFSTKRSEKDEFRILSGFYNGRLTGTPFCAVIENKDAKSKDYEELKVRPRPGHADFTGALRYLGANDPGGGGHFSGRLTAPLCIAGGICKQILEKRGIFIGAHIAEIAGIADDPFDLVKTSEKELLEFESSRFAVINKASEEKMRAAIKDAASKKDSVGGIVECMILGFPAGIGSPMFEGIENKLANAVFGIPAVKGIEFGA